MINKNSNKKSNKKLIDRQHPWSSVMDEDPKFIHSERINNKIMIDQMMCTSNIYRVVRQVSIPHERVQIFMNS